MVNNSLIEQTIDSRSCPHIIIASSLPTATTMNCSIMAMAYLRPDCMNHLSHMMKSSNRVTAPPTAQLPWRRVATATYPPLAKELKSIVAMFSPFT